MNYRDQFTELHLAEARRRTSARDEHPDWCDYPGIHRHAEQDDPESFVAAFLVCVLIFAALFSLVILAGVSAL